MKVKEESEKVGLKFNIQKTKIMTSGPITSWQIDGETVETVADFSFWGSKITADGDCSHEIKIHIFFGSKVMTNLDSILKSRDITLPTKVRLVKAMVFLVAMYGCESWTIKKAESEVTQSCWTLCEPMDYSTPGFLVLHHLPEHAQIHVHLVSDAIYLILCHPHLLLPSIFPSIRVFSSELTLCIR